MKCSKCGYSLPNHACGCHVGRKSFVKPDPDIMGHVPAHFNENGFLQLDLRPWAWSMTREEVRELLAKGRRR